MTGGFNLQLNVHLYCVRCAELPTIPYRPEIARAKAEMKLVDDVEGKTAQYRCPYCGLRIDVDVAVSN
jgi:DNA-directed RNA polymerase subunit RPC12/RpoP